MKKVKIILVMILTMIMLFTATGCRELEIFMDINGDYSWGNDDGYISSEGIADSSGLPTWEGQQRKLKIWNSLTLSGLTYKGTLDVVYPEIKRVTGVTINTDYIIDNAGSFPLKLSMLMSTGSFPDVAIGGSATGSNIIKTGKTYDLTTLLPQYAPNLYARYMAYSPDVFNQPHVNGGVVGKIYGVPFGIGNVGLSTVFTDIDTQKAASFDYNREQYKYVYVRDDVLTGLYEKGYTSYFNGEAPLTQDEIEDIYVDTGSFTEEQLFDVNITSEAQFMNFLRDINTLITNDTTNKYKESNHKIKATHAMSGTEGDNWNLMQMMFSAVQGRPSGVDQMFTYWDREAEEVKLMLNEDFFKDSLKYWQEAILAGIVDKESLTFDTVRFNEKISNGEYAVTYPYNIPNNALLERANKTYKYRKVYLKIDQADRFAYLASEEPTTSALYIFKDSVDAADVPQILMWMDYQSSPLAEKMYAWGPRSAGLFDEVTATTPTTDSLYGNAIGYRKFKNAELEKGMAYDIRIANVQVTNYNLANGVMPTSKTILAFMNSTSSNWLPALTYNKDATDRKESDANVYYSSYIVLGSAEVDPIKRMPTLWFWYDKVPKLESAWQKREGIEKSLTSILSARNPAEFILRYNAMKDKVISAGITQSILDDLDGAFKTYNNGYWQVIKANASNSRA